jgi:hypothetical protein
LGKPIEERRESGCLSAFSARRHGFVRDGRNFLCRSLISRRAKWTGKRQHAEKKENLIRLWRVFQRGLIRTGKKKPASYAHPSNYCWVDAFSAEKKRELIR